MRILAAIGALAIVVGIGAAVFFFGGFYSVAATAEDPAVVTWALTQVRDASINRHAHRAASGLHQRSRQRTGRRQGVRRAWLHHCHGGPGVSG